MSALNQFHFLRPEWFLLLLPAAILVILAIRRQSRSQQWHAVIAPHLLPFLIDGKSIKKSNRIFYGLLTLWIFFTAALAGPTWEKVAQPLHRQNSALVVAWDLSPSMLAQDVKPSRLVRSRLKLIDLLRQRKEGLTALIAYSGEAHVVTPLTDDTETIIALLAGLDPSIMPAKGSNAEMALELANQLLKDGGIASGDIIFLTDGIAPSAQITLQGIQQSQPHSFSVWGIGTPEGAPIPLPNGGFAYDRNGDMVIARLNDKELSDISVALGGLYIPFTQTEFDLRTIQNFVFKPDAKTTQNTNRMFDQWYEQGPLLLLLILPFAALAFRRGWLLTLSFISLGFLPKPAESAELNSVWQNLWQTDDQQASALLESNPAAAAKQFKDEQWQAIANYNAKNYQESLAGFNGETSNDYYNRGTALTQLQQYDEAIAQFQKALELDNNHTLAQHNLSFAKTLKDIAEENNEQNEQQGDGQEGGEQENGDNGENSGDSQNQNGQQESEQNTESSNQQQNDSAQNNQGNQQNSGETSAPNNEEASSQQNNNQNLSDAQQEALEQTYGQQGEEQDETQASNEQEPTPAESQAQTIPQNNGEINDTPANNDDSQPLIARSAEQREQLEAEQSLEQWLRKIPDDPSGLLRNKFRYENGQRKRSLRQNPTLMPNGSQDEERW